MIRTCLEFLLSRAFDSGKLPAAWLQRRVQHDPQLKQFDSEIRQLDSLLRSSAAKRHDCMATEALATDYVANGPVANDPAANDPVANDHVATVNVATETATIESRSADSSATKNSAVRFTLPATRTESLTATNIDADADTDAYSDAKRSGLSPAWLASFAAAALLLLAVAPNWFRPSRPAVHAGEFSQQLTVVPGEVLRLITRAAKTSRTQVPQLSPLANLTRADLSLPAIPAWEDVALGAGLPLVQESRRLNRQLLDRQLLNIDAWQESWLNFKSRLSPPL